MSPCIAQKYNKMKEVEAEEQVMSEESNDEGTLLTELAVTECEQVRTSRHHWHKFIHK